MRALRTVAAGLATFAASVAVAAGVAPSDTKLRQAAFDLYPAVMGRDNLESAFVIGIVFDSDLKVARHSASIPAGSRITSTLFADMFPKMDQAECENAGLDVVRPSRGAGGQFDKGVFALWCVLRAK
jgi:hypothetical protein